MGFGFADKQRHCGYTKMYFIFTDNQRFALNLRINKNEV